MLQLPLVWKMNADKHVEFTSSPLKTPAPGTGLVENRGLPYQRRVPEGLEYYINNIPNGPSSSAALNIADLGRARWDMLSVSGHTCMAESGQLLPAQVIAATPVQMILQPQMSLLSQVEGTAQETEMVADLRTIIERQSQQIALLSNLPNSGK